MGRIQANCVLLLAAIIWGTTFVVQQVGTGGLGAIMFTSTRFFLGAAFVMPFAISQYRKVHLVSYRFERRDWWGMILTGCMLFLGAAFQQFGIFFTSVTNAGFLTALYVPLVPIIALLLLRKHVHWSVWPSSVACLIGTYIMSGVGRIDLQVGDIWVIAGAFFWAAHVLCVGAMSSRTGAPLVVAVVQFVTCAVLGLIFGLILERPVLSDFDGALYGILYAGIMSVGFGFTLQVVGQRFTNPADAAIILSTETVFAAIAGYIFLGERLTTIQFSGAAMIFVGVIAVELLPLTRIGKARSLK